MTPFLKFVSPWTLFYSRARVSWEVRLAFVVVFARLRTKIPRKERKTWMRTLALRFLPRGRARARPSTISSLLHVLQLSSILFSILLFLPSPSVIRHHGAANEEKESDKDDDAWMMMSSSSPFSLSSVRSFVRSFVRKRENFWGLRPWGGSSKFLKPISGRPRLNTLFFIVCFCGVLPSKKIKKKDENLISLK